MIENKNAIFCLSPYNKRTNMTEINKDLSNIAFDYHQALKNDGSFRMAFYKGIQCGKTQFTTAAFKYFMSNEIYQHKYRHMWE
jgi:hypothetical protein